MIGSRSGVILLIRSWDSLSVMFCIWTDLVNYLHGHVKKYIPSCQNGDPVYRSHSLPLHDGKSFSETEWISVAKVAYPHFSRGVSEDFQLQT